MLGIKISLIKTIKIIKYFKNSNLDWGDGLGSKIATLYAQDPNLIPRTHVKNVGCEGTQL